MSAGFIPARISSHDRFLSPWYSNWYRCIDVYSTSTLDVVLKLGSISARISLPLMRIEFLPFALILVLNFIATLFPSSLESWIILVNANPNFSSKEWNFVSPESISLSGSRSSIVSLIQSIHGNWSESFATMTIAYIRLAFPNPRLLIFGHGGSLWIFLS